MFSKQFGNVQVRTVTAPKRGLCLEASDNTGRKILFDIVGMDPILVPDGTNAYMFSNKLLIVTRWSDMSDEEKQNVEHGELVLALHRLDVLQFSICIAGNWGDVFYTLPNCVEGMNEPNLPVNEAVFIFADTHDSNYIICRTVHLPQSIATVLMESNNNCIKNHGIGVEFEKLRLMETDRQDMYDVLYDLCHEKTAKYSRVIRNLDPEKAPNSIYLRIDGRNNTVTDTGSNKAAHQDEPMSAEVKMFRELAEDGIPEAMYNLGVCYERGDGVNKNLEKAVLWYKKAAEMNYAKAQHNLGVCYYNGMGIAKDENEAARLFGLAAEQGNMYAQFNLGICYYQGIGVERDTFKAVDWFRKAAAQGHPEAKKALGM